MHIEVCPTVREADGLAMSSRNAYLSREERRQALAVPQCLERASDMAAAGETDAAKICAAMRQSLEAQGINRIDYVSLADPDTLLDVQHVKPGTVALVAAYVGTTRLIDNRILEIPSVG